MVVFFLTPVIVFLVLYTDFLITENGALWIKTLHRPHWIPQMEQLDVTRAVISVMTTLAVFCFLNTPQNGSVKSYILLSLFLLHGMTNVHFHHCLYHRHQLRSAMLESMLLTASGGLLIFAVYPYTFIGALLFMPHLAWTTLTAASTFALWLLNAPAFHARTNLWRLRDSVRGFHSLRRTESGDALPLA